MSNNFRSMHYGCTVYGDATLAVESGICDAVAFEVQNSEGDQVAAVMLDRAHVRRLITQLQRLVNEPHPGNKAAEQCADAAWYLVRLTPRTHPGFERALEVCSAERLIAEASILQECRRRLADDAFNYFVGGRE